MKDILIISAVFPPEPVVSSKLSFDIVTDLSKIHQVTVLHPRPTRPYGFDFSRENLKAVGGNDIVVSSYVCPQSKLLNRMYESCSFGYHCWKYIEKHHDELSCIYVNSWPLFSQVFIIKVAKKYDIPCIIHIQDIYPESFTNKVESKVARKLLYNLLLPIDKYVLSNANQVLAISSNMKELLSETRGIFRDKITIVENWQDESDFIDYLEKKKSAIRNDKLTFMYLGNNGPVAGVEFLITCFAKAHLFDSRLIIAGSGSRKEACMELAKGYPEINIEFTDVPDGKVPEIQGQADFMLLPVKKGAAMSSIPSKLPAYMFSKKPIIGALDIESDTAKAIIEADCGVVVEPENEQELIKALQEVRTWTVLQIEQKGRNGFEYGMSHFSKEKKLPIITDIIQKYVSKTRN